MYIQLMQYAAAVLCLVLCAVVTACGRAPGTGGTTVTAQRIKVEGAAMFADVLGPSMIAERDGKSVTLDAYMLGQLSLPSGRVVAADGFIMYGPKPFTRKVPPGSYPVTVAVAVFDRSERIAFAQIRFSDRRVTKWEMAVPEGKDPSTLQAGEEFAYAVDSATGCFADPGPQEVLSDPSSQHLFELSAKEMERVYRHTRQWVLIDTPKGSAALFSSGWGDGAYTSYFGLDEAGEPVVLVTDFQVIEWKR